MGYQLPAIQRLLDIDQLKIDYLSKNPARIQLINEIEVTKQILSELELLNNESALAIMVGAYLYGRENIANDYSLLDPTYKPGIFYTTGSSLYSALQKRLSIKEDNPISAQEILIYMSEFYKFVKQHCDLYERDLKNSQSFMSQIKKILKNVYVDNRYEINHLLKAIPSQYRLNQAITKIQKKYLKTTKANNQERKLHIRLLTALNEVLVDRVMDDYKHFLPRVQRIKMGYIIFLMTDIYKNEYILRSPKGNSAAYDLFCDALNINNLNDIDEEVRLVCLTAFETFLCDHKYLTKIEKKYNASLYQEKQSLLYIDPHLHVMRKKLDNMIESLQPSFQLAKVSTFTIGCMALGGLIASAPGYGGGYVMGWGLGLTDEMVKIKSYLSSTTDYVMRVIFGKTGSYLTFFASDMIIDATLERGFAKILEALATLMGMAAGGLVGLTIKELSYDTLKNLFHLYDNLHQKLTPTLAKDVDLNYLTCLLSLPEDIFPHQNRKKLKTIMHDKELVLEKETIVDESMHLRN